VTQKSFLGKFCKKKFNFSSIVRGQINMFIIREAIKIVLEIIFSAIIVNENSQNISENSI
jgi:hypothetical protein